MHGFIVADLIKILCTMDGDMIFSNNPADYNRVVCMACGAKVKVNLCIDIAMAT